MITNDNRSTRTHHEDSYQESFCLINKEHHADDQMNVQKSQESNSKDTIIPDAIHFSSSNDVGSFKLQEETGGEEQADLDGDDYVKDPCEEEQDDDKRSSNSSTEKEDDEDCDSSSMDEDDDDDEESSTSSMEDDTHVSNHVPKEITISNTTETVENKSTKETNNAIIDTRSEPIMPGYTGEVFVSKRNKEYFCQFAKVLVKYLQMVFPSLYPRAKYIICKCDEYKKENKPGFEILAFSIQFNLRRLVGKEIWKKTEGYHTKWLLQHFMTNNTFSTNAEAKIEARRIAHIGHQPLVHPSKLRGYRGKKNKQVHDPSPKNESEMTNCDGNDDDDEVDSILKDYVIVGKMESLNISS